MIVGAKTRYALRALMILSRMPRGASVSISDLAGRSAAPEKYLEVVLQQLRNAGLVESTRGRAGGYRLAALADTVSLARVASVMEPGLLFAVPEGARESEAAAGHLGRAMDEAAWGESFRLWKNLLEATTVEEAAGRAFGAAYTYSI